MAQAARAAEIGMMSLTVAGHDVSRETSERLTRFVALLEKWTAKINLVASSTLPEIWERHVADSLQLIELAPPAAHWADLGSGGGLPGAVVAIVMAETRPEMRVTLVESDQRKAAFLRTVARETGLGFGVEACRIETLPPLGAQVISARALGDLSQLLSYFERHAGAGGTGLFPKGENWPQDVAKAREKWHFGYDAIESRTRPGAAILKIKDVSRV